MKILNNINCNQKCNNITFGHYLDSEKSELQRKLSNLSSDISRLEQLKRYEYSSFSSKEASLEHEIQDVQQEVNTSASREASLQNKVYYKRSEVDREESRNSNLSRQIDNNNTKIKTLQDKQKQAYDIIIKKNKKIDEENATILLENTAQLNNNFTKEVEIATNGLKQALIHKVINPTINSVEGEDDKIPSSIYMHQEGEMANKINIGQTILRWIAKNTESNAAYIDAASFENKDDFITCLKKILAISVQRFEKLGQHSFTAISNFETLEIPKINKENKNILESVLTQGANIYHNTIIAFSDVLHSKIDINNLFTLNFKINKDFLENKHFGLPSLIQNLKK